MLRDILHAPLEEREKKGRRWHLKTNYEDTPTAYTLNWSLNKTHLKKNTAKRDVVYFSSKIDWRFHHKLEKNNVKENKKTNVARM